MNLNMDNQMFALFLKCLLLLYTLINNFISHLLKKGSSQIEILSELSSKFDPPSKKLLFLLERDSTQGKSTRAS